MCVCDPGVWGVVRGVALGASGGQAVAASERQAQMLILSHRHSTSPACACAVACACEAYTVTGHSSPLTPPTDGQGRCRIRHLTLPHLHLLHPEQEWRGTDPAVSSQHHAWRRVCSDGVTHDDAPHTR